MNKDHVKRREQLENELFDDVDKIKEALAAATHDAKNKASTLLSQSVDDARHLTDEMQSQISQYVVKKPLQSIGIALLVGGMIGFLIGKK
jgi:ElaB/YqjD/DUF883 family membrane-anchored ribosome-binding protein